MGVWLGVWLELGVWEECAGLGPDAAVQLASCRGRKLRL